MLNFVTKLHMLQNHMHRLLCARNA